MSYQVYCPVCSAPVQVVMSLVERAGEYTTEPKELFFEFDSAPNDKHRLYVRHGERMGEDIGVSVDTHFRCPNAPAQKRSRKLPRPLGLIAGTLLGVGIRLSRMGQP